jgi:glycosyltransferase involved in cell wall biosynthesis
MNLIYLAIEEPTINSGVPGKIKNQVRCLRNEGHYVKLVFIVYDYSLNEPFYLEVNEEYWVLYLKTYHFTFISKMVNRHRLFGSLSSIIRKEAFDFLYIRYPHYIDYSFYRFSRVFKKKLILESQTKEKDELLLSRNYLKATFEMIFKKKILKNLYACIGVTDEITNYQKRYDKTGSVLFKTIGNGIDVSSRPLAKVSSYPERTINLLYVGNVFPHHGLDRLLRGMAAYNGCYKISFKLIGNGSHLHHLKKLVRDFHIEESVDFVKPKYGKELDKYFDWAHFGIGALGIHRKGLSEASVLKLRDYAARGLPFVMSGNDPDLDNASEIQKCLYRVALDDTPLNMNHIIEHIQEIYSTYIDSFSVDLRKFAEKKLDMNLKMKELTEFLEA